MNHTLSNQEQAETPPQDAWSDDMRASGSASELPDVSVIVPLYNEEECVAQLLESLTELQTLLEGDYLPEFVLVDDGSRDSTVERIEQAVGESNEFRLIKHGTNRGIAAAIHTGLTEARAPLAASIDSDGSYDVALLAEMLPLTGPDTPMVTASPYHRLGDVVGVPAWRVNISRAASKIYGRLMPRPLDCYTSCFRTYDRASVLRCKPTNEGFTGVAELAWNVQRAGGAIAEHPAVLHPRQAGVSKMRVGRTIVAHVRLMCRIALARIIDQFRNPHPTTKS